MKSFRLMQTILMVILTISTQLLLAGQAELVKVQQAIERNHLPWRAGETKISRLSQQDRQKLYGAIPEQIDDGKRITLPVSGVLPETWDWRDNDGNWMSPVTDQQLCGSCVHMSTIGAVEAWYKIKSGNPRTQIDLSEQFLLSCGTGSCENGWYISEACDFLRDIGVPREECLPWVAHDRVSCDSACSDWRSQAVRIPDWATVGSGQADVTEIKNAIFYRPVVTSFAVYTSFQFYESGIYQHPPGDSIDAWHAVVLVGWEDKNQCWIAKNSWDTDWGEHGYFRIHWGDSFIGTNTTVILDGSEGHPVVQMTPSEINLSLSPAEKAYRTLELTNSGDGTVEYVTSLTLNPMPDMNGVRKDWIDVHFGTGWLASGETAFITLQIQATQLALGTYQGAMTVETDETVPHSSWVIPITVQVAPHEHDLAIESCELPARVAITTRIQPMAVLHNWGNTAETDFDVQCHVFMAENEIFSDVCHLSEIPAADTAMALFGDFTADDSAVYKIEYSLSGAIDDENSSNDLLQAYLATTNVIDDFETECLFWDTDSTWGISDEFGGGYHGHKMMHCNRGRHYQNNMNSCLTYLPGFDLSNRSGVVLRFWTRYAIENHKDFCFIEASNNGQNWQELAAITGTKMRWHQRDVSLSDFTGPGNDKVRIRFRFVSDAVNTVIGFMLDDLEIDFGVETAVETPIRSTSAPDEFILLQNYPNPFSAKNSASLTGSSTTKIEFDLPVSGQVQVAIYDQLGRHVKTLVNSYSVSGHHQTSWDGRDDRDLPVAAGVYFCKMSTINFERIIKLALVK